MHGFTQRIALDPDSTEIPPYGGQEQGPHHGYFESTCYPLRLVFKTGRRLLGGQVATGERAQRRDWEDVPRQEIECRQELGDKEVVFRADAAFAKPEIYRGAGRMASKIRDSASGLGG